MVLSSKTILMLGGSRGIGLGIAKRCAEDGANVVIAILVDKAIPDFARYHDADDKGQLMADFFVPKALLAQSKSNIIQNLGYEDKNE